MVNAKEMALAAAKALDSKKGRDIKVLEIDKITTLADYFVICSGGSNTQINALCDEVEKELDQLGEQPIHREGYRYVPLCISQCFEIRPETLWSGNRDGYLC